MRSLGIHVVGDHVHAAVIDRTPLGVRPGRVATRPLSGHRPARVMREVAETLLAGRRGEAIVNVGLPASALHYRAPRISPAPSRGAMQSLDLLSSLLPPGWFARDAVVRLTRYPSRIDCPFKVAAVPRALLDELRIGPLPGVTVRYEPAPLAHLRVSLAASPPAEVSGLELRLCDAYTGGIGYLLDGAHAVAWLEAGAAAPGTPALEAVAAELARLARTSFSAPILAVTVQGTPTADLTRLGAAAGGITASLVPGPGFYGPSVAHGLALHQPGDDASELGIHLDPALASPDERPARWLVWALAGMVGAMLALDANARRLAGRIAGVRASTPVRAFTTDELFERRRLLTDLVLRCGHFVDRPVSWSMVLDRLARAVPDSVAVATIECTPPRFDAVEGRAQPDYSLRVAATERQLLLESVLSDPYLRRTFPEADLSRHVAAGGAGPPLFILTASGRRKPGSAAPPGEPP